MDASVVWVVDAPGASLDARARGALDDWARAHGVILTATAPAPAPPAAAVGAATGASLVKSVEDELDRARDALSALEIDAAERALARADATLRAHPELPQAAWLLAEVERGWSARWLRGPAPDETRASRAWQRAAALDLGRSPGVGERAFAAAADVSAILAIDDADGLTIRLDGAPISQGALTRGAGDHLLTLALARSNELVWAGWVTLGPGTRVRLAAPRAPACSAPDLAGASLDAAEPRRVRVSERGVRCTSWVAVATGLRDGSVRAARCEASRCEPLVDWKVGVGESEAIASDHGARALPARPAAPDAETRRWPAWGTWTLVGVGVAAVTVVVVVASGALAPAPVETRFMNGGVRPTGGVAF